MSLCDSKLTVLVVSSSNTCWIPSVVCMTPMSNVSIDRAPDANEEYMTHLKTESPLADWFAEEQSKLESLWLLLTEIAADRCWNQIFFTIALPPMFAGIYHDDPRQSTRHLKKIRSIFDAILKAEVSTDQQIRKQLQLRLSEVSYHKMQLCRELYLLGESENWETRGPDSILLKMCHHMFGAPVTTKFTLEDLFAHLTSVGKLSTLATSMNKILGLQFDD